MIQPDKISNRKKFLLWGVAVLSSFTALRFLTGSGKNKTTEQGNTVKMLTQDGTLVEIDKKFLTSYGKKVTNEELQRWVKK